MKKKWINFEAHSKQAFLYCSTTFFIKFKPAAHICVKTSIFIMLQYTGQHGLLVGNKLQKLIRRHCPRLQLRATFESSFRLSDLLQLKYETSRDIRTRVLYQFSYCSCNATYIGKTTRNFRQCVCKPFGISSRTGSGL